MRVTMAAMAILGVLVTVGAVPAAGQQARWEALELPVDGGREFRLYNDEGSAIILQCLRQAVGAGFEFAEPIERTTQRVTVRSVPGQQRNIAVQAVTERIFRIASGRGRDFLLRMLSGAASISVRASGQRVGFQVFGSDAIVSQCVLQQQGENYGLEYTEGLPAARPMQTGGLVPLRAPAGTYPVHRRYARP